MTGSRGAEDDISSNLEFLTSNIQPQRLPSSSSNGIGTALVGIISHSRLSCLKDTGNDISASYHIADYPLVLPRLSYPSHRICPEHLASCDSLHARNFRVPSLSTLSALASKCPEDYTRRYRVRAGEELPP